jgi:hypothetical protein
MDTKSDSLAPQLNSSRHVIGYHVYKASDGRVIRKHCLEVSRSPDNEEGSLKSREPEQVLLYGMIQ